jgi:hypothetical protein
MSLEIQLVHVLSLITFITSTVLLWLKGQACIDVMGNLSSYYQFHKMNEVQKVLLSNAITQLRQHLAGAEVESTPTYVRFVLATGLEYTIHRRFGRHLITYDKTGVHVPRQFEPDATAIVDYYSERRFVHMMTAGLPCSCGRKHEDIELSQDNKTFH